MDRKETARLLMGTFKRLQHGMHHNIYSSLKPKQKPSHMFVMMRLRKEAQAGNNGIRVSEIASAMGISVPGVTQILTGLEKDGYIRREMDPADRRAVRVFMTAEGETMMDPAMKLLEERFDGLIGRLGEKNSLILIKLLLETEQYFSESTGSQGEGQCP